MFEDWRELAVPTGWQGAAAYYMRLVVGPVPVCVPRLLASDPMGIMSIGSTGNMQKRQGDFRRACRTCSGHSSGNLVWYLRTRTAFLDHFPGSRFEFTFRRYESVVQAEDAEEHMLKAYFCSFGEMPPLNSSIPRRYGDGGWNAARATPWSGCLPGGPS